MNGEFYTHIHMSAGNDKGEVFGGHLNKAVVSATCEMVIDIIDGKVDRYFDEEIGFFCVNEKNSDLYIIVHTIEGMNEYYDLKKYKI